MPQADKSTFLSPDEETDFRKWYSNVSAILNLDSNPDSPEHFYDYRRAYKAGFDPISSDNPSRHWPSEYKYTGHPREYLYDPDTNDILNTTTGEHGFFKHMKSTPPVGEGSVPPSILDQYAMAFDHYTRRGDNLLARLLHVQEPYPQLEPTRRDITDRPYGLVTPTATATPSVTNEPESESTPIPTQRPPSSPTPKYDPSIETDTGGWNIYNRPTVSFMGGSDAAAQGRTYYKNYKTIGDYGKILANMGLGNMTWREFGELFAEATAKGIRQQAESAMSGTPLFTIHGDPFHHNIRELNLPHNAPLMDNRLFWKERAL